jgi:hypothetical protein
MPFCDGRGGKRAVRAVFSGFARSERRFAFPVPTVKVVQEHGTVEIMRGCPNGCRFCHAGYFYRPQRAKPYELIRSEVESLVRDGGYREITLASLSSGDYPGVADLLRALNTEWARKRISFQLPSLKVNSFTLPLIKGLSEVRKSGLTFAVETPCDEWQSIINKDVSFDQTVAILKEAKYLGFKQAKFYFMLGLPVTGSIDEEATAIVQFFSRLFSKLDFQVNVNIGTFVPKPHTPFQWSAQVGEEAAMTAINSVRSGLRHYRGIKLSYHSPFASQIEGVIARGDERVGDLIRRAYDKGARLDAWEEHLDRELWRTILRGEGKWNPVDELCSEKAIDVVLPWDDISIGVSKAYLREELDRSINHNTTLACADNCTNRCGSCTEDVSIGTNHIHNFLAELTPRIIGKENLRQDIVGRIILRLSKRGTASYFQHLSIIDALARAIQMIDLPIAFSEGFNPMPRIETGQPLPIAVASECEIVSIFMVLHVNAESSMAAINQRLPSGLRVEEAEFFSLRSGIKQRTIGSISWGSNFKIKPVENLNTNYLKECLSNYLSRIPIEGAILAFEGDGSASITLPDPKMKDHSLVRILESCTSIRPIQAAFSISRQFHYADVGEGPRSFFEAFRQTSS